MASHNQKLSDEDFVKLYETVGPRAIARMFDYSSDRPVMSRRRSLERIHQRQINAPEAMMGAVKPEFPDWQEAEVKNGYMVAFSDSHLIPHHKSTAHKALLKVVKELQPAAIVDMGDLLDFASISRHHRIGWDRQFNVKDEVFWAKDCLEELGDELPAKCKKYRTRGNHDQRYAGHISNNLASYEGLKGFTLEDQLPDWPVSWALKVNGEELFIAHRWKGGLHGPFNNTLWAGVSYATGHQHQQKVYPLTDLRGDRWGVDVGCMSAIYSPHFRYLEGRPRNFRSGFAVFRFVNFKLREPKLCRVIDEAKGLVEFMGRDIQV
ncbi:MAG TPA: hypothetical protein VFA81_06585 [Burkholderiales bacterium]|nr:hypothetical protein [Burkholderiales bacterium]